MQLSKKAAVFVQICGTGSDVLFRRPERSKKENSLSVSAEEGE